MNRLLHSACRRSWGFCVAVYLAAALRAAAGGCSPASAGIISWWPGDGNAADIAGTNNGTLQGGAIATAPGLVGQAFGFDGTNNYVQIPDAPGLRPTNLTVEAWVLFTSLDSAGSGPAVGSQYIVFKQNSRSSGFEGFCLNKTRSNGQDHLAFQVTSATGQNIELDSVSLVTTGTWYHVVGVRGTNFAQLYINGNLEGQNAVGFPQDYGNYPLYFGTSGQSSWDRRLKGVLDEVSFYNRALSSSEIAAIYVAGAAGKCKSPGILVQPQSQTVLKGSNVIFTIAATGFGVLSYQWQFNGLNLDGASSTNLTLSNVQSASAGTYTVLVTNKLGSTMSLPAVLVVLTPPAITTPPQSLTNVAGTTAMFSVAANGSMPLSYQWLANGLNVAGGTNASLTLNAVQPTDAGNYAVIVTNPAGVVTSAVATLTVLVPPSIATPPQSLTNVAGTTAMFSVAANGSMPLSYQWLANGLNVAGGTNASLTLNAVQPTDAGNYAVIVTNLAGVVTSAVATLTVLVPPSIATPPQSLTNVAGTTAMFSVAANGSMPLNYLWLKSGTNLLSTGGNITGADSPVLTVLNVLAGDAGIYSVAVSNAAGIVVSSNAVLSVIDPAVIAQPVSSTTFAGGSVTFSVSASGTPPLNYQWQLDGTDIPGANSAVLTLNNVQVTNAGIYAALITNPAGSTTSLSATLTVAVQAAVADPNLNAALASALGKCEFDTFDLQTLTHLEACNAGISNLTGLQWATNLASLNLGGNLIRDLSPLQSLTQLNTLLLYNNLIADASGLSGLTNLSYLELRNNPLTNAEIVLAGLTNLTSLYLGGTSISNLTFAQNLRGLTFLNLDHDNIGDLSPLSALPNLTGLGLGYNPLTNIAQLSGFRNLSSLNLSGDSISNLLFVTNLTQLISLNLCSNAFTDLSPLATLPNLGGLNLARNPQITDYSAVSAVSSLSNLWLYSNSISNLPLLELAYRLAYLNLDDNSISNLTPLSGMTQLNYLSLERNPIGQCAALAGLTNLMQLSLRSDKFISDLTFLENLKQLGVLDLGDNQISDASPLAGLTSLGRLDLGWNPLADYGSALGGLTGLSSLSLAGDSVADLSFLANLKELTSLDVSTNQIADLSPLSGLTNLASVQMAQNRVTNIGVLSSLPKLNDVNLCLNLLDLDPVGMPVAVIQSLKTGCPPVKVDLLPQRTPPVITSQATLVGGSWYIAAATNTVLTFTVTDSGPPGAGLGVGASSSNESVVPGASLLPSQENDGGWILAVSPTTNQPGTTILTLSATNEVGLSADLQVHVTAVIPQTVNFADPNLAAAVNSQLGKPPGNLTTLDLLGLTYLSVVGGITDLSGLERASNLTSLYLNGVSVSNLMVLQNLPRLMSLAIFNTATFAPAQLAGMTNLADLYLNADSITDLSFLQNLTGLKELSLNANQITNVAPLSGLTNLFLLSLQENRISAIPPLASESGLSYLDLRLNVLDTNASSGAVAVIQGLQNQGVLVDYVPQRMPPRILAPINWVITAGTTASALFTVEDYLPSDGRVTVSVQSLNPVLIPSANLGLTQNSIYPVFWEVEATPLANLLNGQATVRITATNEVGLGWLWDIQVTVTPPLLLDGRNLASPTLAWSTCANAPWFGESLVTHDGVSAAQSGRLGDGSESWLETSVVGPGTISFWWKVSSETNSDWLEFFENEVLQPVRISGETDWNQRVLPVGIGPQTLKWSYAKDYATSSGMDAAWLDDVLFTPGCWLEMGGSPTNGQCPLLLHTVLGDIYQLQVSSNLVNWSALAYLVPTNNLVPFLDATAGSSPRFYRLRQFPGTSIQLQSPSLVGNQLQLQLTGPPGLRLEIQTSTNLVDWSLLGVATNTLGTVPFTDPFPATAPSRFYRTRPLP